MSLLILKFSIFGFGANDLVKLHFSAIFKPK